MKPRKPKRWWLVMDKKKLYVFAIHDKRQTAVLTHDFDFQVIIPVQEILPKLTYGTVEGWRGSQPWGKGGNAQNLPKRPKKGKKK